MSQSTKLFFATDLHGSDVCFRKFLNTLRWPSPPNVLIIGGDITGKFVVPIVLGKAFANLYGDGGQAQEVAMSDLSLAESVIANAGGYVYRCSADNLNIYRFSALERDRVAEELQLQRLESWLQLAEKRLEGVDTKLIINCGNDDSFKMDDLIRRHPRVIFPDQEVVSLNEQQVLLSIGASTPTPWHCAREMSEDEMHVAIETLVSKLPRRGEALIFNFHCPPFGTQLDLAPKLDKELRPIVGPAGPEFAHAGSVAIREAIETLQPVLTLHGHIHEQHRKELLGKTLSINPGSSYWNGHLQGALVVVEGKEVTSAHLTKESEGETGSLSPALLAMLKGIPWLGHFLHRHLVEEPEKQASSAKQAALNAKIDNILDLVKGLQQRPPESIPKESNSLNQDGEK